MADINFLYISYMIIWSGIFLYIAYLHLEQRKLARDVEMLKEVLDERRDRSG